METNKIKKVFIALDYDKSAESVAEAGYSLAKAMNAETTLLHVIYEHLTYYVEYYSAYEIQLDHIKDLRMSMHYFLDEIKKHLGDEWIHTMIKEGVIAQSILEAAEEINADVIVLGAHSRNWFENIIMGDDAKAVLKKTKVPLFIVPIKTESK